MKLKHLILEMDRNAETIAVFGQAKLIKISANKYELLGGSRADHAEAIEWISLFMHEATIRSGTSHRPRSA